MKAGTINGTNEKIITASMVLSRQLLSVFMVTYLPTILMNVINQSINYITSDNKDKNDPLASRLKLILSLRLY